MLPSFLKIKNSLFILIAISVFLFFYFLQPRKPELISLFPVQNYDQNISHWIKPTDSNYQHSLLTPALQKIRYDEWYSRNYGIYSPWNKDHVSRICSLITSESLSSIEQEIVNSLNEPKKMGYGSNFRPYPPLWTHNLQIKMNLKQFDIAHYDPTQRAIATTNITARLLPTQDVYFNYKLPVFDKLAVSIIWAGTPLYILGKTLEGDWSLALAPSFIAWIKSTDLSYVDEQFINSWEQSTKKGLAAILQTDIPINDVENQLYRFSGYIGMVLPGTVENNQIHILIPVSNEKGTAPFTLLSSLQNKRVLCLYFLRLKILQTSLISRLDVPTA